LFFGKDRLIIFRKRVPGLSEATLGRFVARASQAARLRGVINVAVTGNRELRALNLRFLKKDRPTDVLSFPPMLGFSEGCAGDVAISAEIAAQNARRLGHTAAEEVKILALHGILHLAGYDHERDRGRMARREQALRKSLGLPVGLIERSTLSGTEPGKIAPAASARKGAARESHAIQPMGEKQASARARRGRR